MDGTAEREEYIGQHAHAVAPARAIELGTPKHDEVVKVLKRVYHGSERLFKWKEWRIPPDHIKVMGVHRQETMSVGDVFFGRRIRQNHALEHATVTILSQKVANLRVSARSNPQGFVIFGHVDLDKVRAAAGEALERLQAGEAELAIHPNCGTNVAVGISVTAISWLFTLLLLRPRARLFSAIGGVLGAAMLARPFGAVVQRHVTTLPDLRGVSITGIRRRSYLGLSAVEVQTAQVAGLLLSR